MDQKKFHDQKPVILGKLVAAAVSEYLSLTYHPSLHPFVALAPLKNFVWAALEVVLVTRRRFALDVALMLKMMKQRDYLK